MQGRIYFFDDLYRSVANNCLKIQSSSKVLDREIAILPFEVHSTYCYRLESVKIESAMWVCVHGLV